MGSSQANDTKQSPRVGLLVTCLVDLYRPAVGFAAVELLEQAGCDESGEKCGLGFCQYLCRVTLFGNSEAAR